MAARPFFSAVFVVLLAWPLAGQSSPGLQSLQRCADRNGTTDVSEGTLSVPMTPSGGQGTPFEVALRVTLTQPLTLQGVELLLGNATILPGINPFGSFQVYDEDPATGLPGTVLTATGPVTSAAPLANGLSWTGGLVAGGIPLAAGTPYWISYFDFLGFGTICGTQNASGPDVTLYTTGSPLGGVPWATPQATERLKLRLLATNCPVPSNASIASVGSGCGGSTTPTLLTTGLPLVGNGNFAFLVSGGTPNLPAAVFWAPTADPVGTIVAAPSCRLYLDFPGTLALINAGLNPLGAATTGLTGIATIPFPIPADPSLDGFSAAFQGVLIDPAGAPTGTPGLSIALTPAVVATIGL